MHPAKAVAAPCSSWQRATARNVLLPLIRSCSVTHQIHVISTNAAMSLYRIKSLVNRAVNIYSTLGSRFNIHPAIDLYNYVYSYVASHHLIQCPMVCPMTQFDSYLSHWLDIGSSRRDCSLQQLHTFGRFVCWPDHVRAEEDLNILYIILGLWCWITQCQYRVLSKDNIWGNLPPRFQPKYIQYSISILLWRM